MKNYKFSLQSVLEIRRNKEKKALEEFATAQKNLEEENEKKKELVDKLDRHFQKKVTAKNIHDLMVENLYRGDLETKIKLQDEIIAEKTIELEEVREKLQIAQREKKTIEKLKEKELEEYKSELQKKKQDELDEFAVLRFKPN